MLEGLFALKKLGFASFWRPAKQKVKPKNARSGRSAHPESARARGGGASKRRRRRRRSDWRRAVDPRRTWTGFVRCDTTQLLTANLPRDVPTLRWPGPPLGIGWPRRG